MSSDPSFATLSWGRFASNLKTCSPLPMISGVLEFLFCNHSHKAMIPRRESSQVSAHVPARHGHLLQSNSKSQGGAVFAARSTWHEVSIILGKKRTEWLCQDMPLGFSCAATLCWVLPLSGTKGDLALSFYLKLLSSFEELWWCDGHTTTWLLHNHLILRFCMQPSLQSRAENRGKISKKEKESNNKLFGKKTM